MFKRNKWSQRVVLFVFFGCTTGLVAHRAAADTKTFAYTYPYMTLPAGEMELEHYLDMEFKDFDDPSTPDVEENDWGPFDAKHQVELEFGITDNWDFGFYNVFSQKAFDSFHYDGVKLRTRYRFGEEDKYFVDPSLYFEVGYFGNKVKLEEMLILAKTIGRFETALNLKAEQEFEDEGSSTEVAYEGILSYAAGWHFTDSFALSAEYYSKVKFADGEKQYWVNYLGPTIHLAVGRFYWNIAAQGEISGEESKADFRIRSLFSIML